ncbi:MAG: exodeoxyribonuclease VII small subunit [Acidobacteria bacterium]|nr:exodeoxyribonuclease VII small subunit [Acidobacteriota bacterium]
MAKTFEESLDQLEAIVRKLEDGDLPLEESLELFEKGVKLSRECKERLVRAERRIEVLMKESNGDLKLEDIDEEE